MQTGLRLHRLCRQARTGPFPTSTALPESHLDGVACRHLLNLSSHLAKLADAGLVEIEKTFERKIPVTYAKLTREGKEALKEYWKRFDKVRAGVRQLKPIRS